jgi:capsular polysaccharide biosynthesis protein
MGFLRSGVNLIIYVSTPSKHFPELCVKSQAGELIQIQWSRVYFKGIRNLVNEVNNQYLNSKLSLLKLIYLALRSQLLLFTRNPRLAIRELIVGLEGKVDGEFSFPIELIHENSVYEKYFWVSRSGITQGVRSEVYGPEIDWDRIRYSQIYKCFVWGLTQIQDQTEIKGSEFELTKMSVALVNKEQIESLETLKEIQFIRLRDCYVYNGIFTLKKNKVYLTDISHSIEPTAWPTNKIGLSEGNHVAIQAIETVTPKLSNAIFLGSSPSWYHFLVEIFPRFLHLVEAMDVRWTVITRGSLPNSILQILAVIGFKDVFSLRDGQRVEVEELVTVADFRFRNTLDVEGRASDILLAREFFKTNYDLSDAKEMFYLKRSSHLFRPLYAQTKVERFLVSVGFRVLLPEELDFHSQIQLLGKAKVIVAASGAALTSMLFLPENCRIIQINDGQDETELWERFTKILGFDLTVIEGRPFAIYNRLTGAGLYRINLRDFKSKIRKSALN